MAYKTKEQAGKELLSAIDAYIEAAMAEEQKRKRTLREEKLCRCIEDHKSNPIRIPEGAHGAYAKCLLEELGNH